jgi:tRNA(Leu) C34 or U34 (ribose-2'-O)-methylase TrmL
MCITDINSVLVFGRETAGLPDEIQKFSQAVSAYSYGVGTRVA